MDLYSKETTNLRSNIQQKNKNINLLKKQKRFKTQALANQKTTPQLLDNNHRGKTLLENLRNMYQKNIFYHHISPL